MATSAHVAYCFEILASDLENRDALSFPQVQHLWEQYELIHNARGNATGRADGQEGQEVFHNHDSLNDDDGNEDDLPIQEPDSEPEPEPRRFTRSALQLPSISRLQALSPASASSSSSTPSTSLSTSSSSAALGGNSKSSSNSSFFSFGRSKQPSPAVPKTEEHPLFVTWNTVSPRSGHKSLRGCIGTFDPQELASGLSSYALTAAFNDTRFPPIAFAELTTLSCSVTLLTNFTTCSSPFDWTLGVHGIRISFSHQHKRFGATYLPDVASDQGWTKEETLVSLMRKAGWSGRTRDWKEVFEKGRGGVVRYEGRKMTLKWDEWVRWRDWTRSVGVQV